MKGLYAIVDEPHPHGLAAAAVTNALVQGGAAAVQLRAKTAATAERVALLTEMAPACRAAGVPLLCNDDVEAAVRAADGVHLGQTDLGPAGGVAAVRRAAPEGFIVGVSTHNPTQLVAAGRLRPDYVAMGPVAPTRSKKNPDPTVGFSGLLEACRLAARPLVAIGGLDETSGPHAIELGATAVAVISALVAPTADEIRDRARAMAVAFAAAAQPLAFSRVLELIPVLDAEQLIDIAKWSDDLGMHVALGLPARFRPQICDGTAVYRRSDVLDLTYALGKLPEESWSAWSARMAADEDPHGTLVQLRRR